MHRCQDLFACAGSARHIALPGEITLSGSHEILRQSFNKLVPMHKSPGRHHRLSD